MIKFYSLVLILVLFLSSCKEDKIVIAVTKASGSQNYLKYSKWIHNQDNDVEVVDLYSIGYDSAMKVMKNADGLILSGGPDIHPVYYGKTFDTARCTIDLHRDSLEFAALKIAKKRELPIIAICRGLQLLNVYEGGSLIVDIPEDYASNIMHQIDSGDAHHNIKIIENSMLYKLTLLSNSVVNSNHHQAIDVLAPSLVPVAFTEDGIIEAIEYKDNNKPFMIGVQWHPERMEEHDVLSTKIITEFLKVINKKNNGIFSGL